MNLAHHHTHAENQSKQQRQAAKMETQGKRARSGLDRCIPTGSRATYLTPAGKRISCKVVGWKRTLGQFHYLIEGPGCPGGIVAGDRVEAMP